MARIRVWHLSHAGGSVGSFDQGGSSTMLHTCRLLGRLDRGVDSALLRKVHSAFRFWVRDLISDFGFEIQSLVFRVLGCRWGEQKGAKGSERYSVHTGDTIRRFDRGGFALL